MEAPAIKLVLTKKSAKHLGLGVIGIGFLLCSASDFVGFGVECRCVWRLNFVHVGFSVFFFPGVFGSNLVHLV